MYRQHTRNLGKIIFDNLRFLLKTDSQNCMDKKFSKKNQEFFIDKKTPRFFSGRFCCIQGFYLYGFWFPPPDVLTCHPLNV